MECSSIKRIITASCDWFHHRFSKCFIYHSLFLFCSFEMVQLVALIIKESYFPKLELVLEDEQEMMVEKVALVELQELE